MPNKRNVNHIKMWGHIFNCQITENDIWKHAFIGEGIETGILIQCPLVCKLLQTL